MKYYLYVLQCADGTLYAGITTDISRRVSEHNESKRGAKYTAVRRPAVLVYSKEFPNRSDATKAEIEFKRLTRREKLVVITSSDQ